MADRVIEGCVITDSIQIEETEFVSGKMERKARAAERQPREPDKECER